MQLYVVVGVWRVVRDVRDRTSFYETYIYTLMYCQLVSAYILQFTVPFISSQGTTTYFANLRPLLFNQVYCPYRALEL